MNKDGMCGTHIAFSQMNRMNKMKRHNNARVILYFLVVLFFVLGLLVSGLQILESTIFSNGSTQETPRASKTIVRDGIEYFPRQDITVILALGIDEEGPVVSSGSYRNSGEADAVILLILDEKEGTYSQMCLNRDTMMEMPALGIGGKEAGTFYGQLALSHTYGEGLADSCENTRKAVSDYLYGITIDHYVALNMDAIAIVNDTVGGVTVNVKDDFSHVDESIQMGQVTLSGSQALSYVRSRMDVGNQLNISRMERHEQYMKGLMEAIRTKMDGNDSFALKLYDQVDEYMVTDCSSTVISGLLERCAEYSLKEIVSPEGSNVLGEEYYEFYADEEKLDEMILRIFYAPKG